MRTARDRIRHAISFEIIALLIVIPLGAWVFSVPVGDIGVVAVVSATIAMVWVYLYNFAFDHLLLRLSGHVGKSPGIRVVHAVAFEIGMLLILMPYIAWHLGVGWIEALKMDVSFAFFYVVYAFVFNWIYDIVFPVPGVGSRQGAPGSP